MLLKISLFTLPLLVQVKWSKYKKVPILVASYGDKVMYFVSSFHNYDSY